MSGVVVENPPASGMAVVRRRGVQGGDEERTRADGDGSAFDGLAQRVAYSAMPGRDERGRLTRTEPNAGRPGVDADELYLGRPDGDEHPGDDGGAPGVGGVPDGGAAEAAAVVRAGRAEGGEGPSTGLATRGAPASRTPDALRPGSPLLEIDTTLFAKYAERKGIDLWSAMTPLEQKQARALVIALKSEGWGIRPIYTKTRLGRTLVERILRDARDRSELKDVLADMDMECLPQAVDNIRRFLREGTTDRAERATYKMLEGRGLLVAHQKTAGVSMGSMTLEVVYKNAPVDPPAPTGQVFTSPRAD